MALTYLRALKILSVPAYSTILVESKSDPCECQETGVCRASDLPIYTQCEEIDFAPLTDQEERLPTYLEQAVDTTKTVYTKCSEAYAELKEEAKTAYETTKNNITTFVAYLREEENSPQRIGAVGAGALIGLILGMRGRFIKKTFCTTLGALGAAAICYPEDAAEIAEASLEEAQNIWEAAYDLLYPGQESSLASPGASTEPGSDVLTIKDPQDVITKTHDTAVSKSCHCPIGACLGHSDE